VFHLPLVVFTPADAPQTKLAAIRRHGAELRAEGRDYDHAEILAKQFAQDTGATFISPYSDPDVIAGAATIAVEIFEDAPLTDTLIVPIGGGGLISGVAAAVKALAPATRVFGVEVDVSCAFQTSVRAGKLVEIVPGPSLADGLGGNPDPQTITFDFVQRYVDQIVTVSETDLAAAIVGLIEHEHLVAEGAGGAATAAIVGRRLDVAGRRVAVIQSGSNIDRTRLTRLLQSFEG
jgi:threonine dehydratase